MAIKLMSANYCNLQQAMRKEYLCDTDADFAELPECCTGSTAVSIESGKVMVVSTFGNWIPFGEGYVEKAPLENVIGTWVLNDSVSSFDPNDYGTYHSLNINGVMYSVNENGEFVPCDFTCFYFFPAWSSSPACIATQTPAEDNVYSQNEYHTYSLGEDIEACRYFDNNVPIHTLKGSDLTEEQKMLFRTITISDGADITNEKFITWINANATKVG